MENLEVIRAEASFDGERTVRGGGQVRRGKRIVINTGLSATVPATDGLQDTPFLTNDTIFELQELPQRLCVLGGGYVGLELGQAMARFGSEVTIIDHGERLLDSESRQVSHLLQQSFTDEGIKLRLGASLQRVTHDGSRFHLSFAEGTPLQAEALLVAAGRRPNTKALAADRAGVKLDERGYVVIDECFHTTAAGVYAIGDCARQPPFTHVSSEDRRRLEPIWRAEDDGTSSGESRRRDDRVLAYAVFTDPSVGRVGYDETQAKAAGRSPVVHRVPLTETARGKEWGLTCGYFEIIIDKSSERLLGATFVGYEACELVQMFLPLMQQKLGWKAVAESVFVHPTFGEDIMMLARRGVEASG